MPEFSLAAPADEKELAAVLDIVSHALNFPRDLADRFAAISGPHNFRALRGNAPGRPVVGGLVIHPMGHWFGGRNVPMGGIGGVGVAPEHRAGGAATTMMNLAVREMFERGTPLSSLYPATVPVYRRAGYELAGSRYEVNIALRQLRLPKGAGDMRLERIVESDREEVEALYVEQAAHSAGALQRGEFSWKRVYAPRGEVAQGYKVLDERGRMEGYVFLLQKEESHGGSAGQPRVANPALFYLLVCDAQFRSARAGLRILELMRQHRSVCEIATFYGSPDHPLAALIPERSFVATHQFHWMTRVVDVEKALLARGWNRAIAGEATFAIRDDVIEANNAAFTLQVGKGSAAVKRSGRAQVTIDIRGFAALYSGLMTPNDLINWGYLGAEGGAKQAAETLETLAGLFAGPRPYLSDMF